MAQGAQLNGGRQLDKIRQENPDLGYVLEKLFTGVNTLAENTANTAVGRLPAPPPPNGLSVKVGGEYAHVVIQHAAPVQQGIHYFVEVANNEGFVGAHPIHYGTSRTRDPIHLAPLDDNGAAQKFYLRAYAQYPGGDPSPVYVHPVAIQTTGSTRLTWNQSTGSGTASNTGQQTGWGFGRVRTRD